MSNFYFLGKLFIYETITAVLIIIKFYLEKENINLKNNISRQH